MPKKPIKPAEELKRRNRPSKKSKKQENEDKSEGELMPEESRDFIISLIEQNISLTLSKISDSRKSRAQDKLNALSSRIKTKLISLKVPTVPAYLRNYKKLTEQNRELEEAIILENLQISKLNNELEVQEKLNEEHEKYLNQYKKSKEAFDKMQNQVHKSKLHSDLKVDYDKFLPEDSVIQSVVATEIQTSEIDEIKKSLTDKLLKLEDNQSSLLPAVHSLAKVKDMMVQLMGDNLDVFE